MVSLLDLGPLSREVKIRNAEGMELKLKIRPITAETIFNLIWRFQTFRSLMEGDLEKLDSKTLMGKLGPMALAAIIVQCTGGVPEPTEEEVAKAGGSPDEAKAKLVEQAEYIARNELSADAQSEILTNVFEISFREGVGPFVERIRKLIASIGPQGLEQATSLQEELFSVVHDVHLPKSGKKLRGKYSPGLN